MEVRAAIRLTAATATPNQSASWFRAKIRNPRALGALAARSLLTSNQQRLESAMPFRSVKMSAAGGAAGERAG